MTVKQAATFYTAPMTTSICDSSGYFSKMRPVTPNLAFPQSAGPSSPPETPTSPTFTHFNPPRSSRQDGIYNFSRPFPAHKGDKNPVVQGQHLGYHSSMRPEDISPRSSSPSSESSGSPPRSLCSETELPDSVPETSPVRFRIRSEGNFVIEELRDSDIHFDSDDALSVVHPDHYEDAESDCAKDAFPNPTASDLDARVLADGLEKLDCNNHNDEREAWIKMDRKKRRIKRLSSGSHHKRTLSQSIGSGTDDEDLQQIDANEAGSSARRLRRKTEDRTSLIFDDPPQMIIEEPESSDELAPMQVAEPDVAIGVEELGLYSLPYYDMDDMDDMDVMDTDSTEMDSNSD